METDYLQAIYEVAKEKRSDVLVQNIMAYRYA